MSTSRGVDTRATPRSTSITKWVTWVSTGVLVTAEVPAVGVVCVCDVDSEVSLSSTARRASRDVGSTFVIGGRSTPAIGGRETGW